MGWEDVLVGCAGKVVGGENFLVLTYALRMGVDEVVLRVSCIVEAEEPT